MSNVMSVVSKGTLTAIRSQAAKKVVSALVGAIVGGLAGDLYSKAVGTNTPDVVVEN
jgi:outer membrane lipoprotein SlyB